MKRHLPMIIKALERINTWAAVLGMTFVLPLMLITTLDVIGRSVLDRPLPGTYELSEFMLAIIILLGAGYTQHEKGHVALGLFASRFGPRVQKTVRMVTLILSLSIITIMVWQGYLLGLGDKEVTDQLRIPTGPFKLLVGIGGSLLWLQLLADLLKTIDEMLRKPQ